MIGILGGTFDPIHFGHLIIAKKTLVELHLQEVQLIPCNIPPHRQLPHANAEDRLQMVILALQPQAQIKMNPIEIQRGGISYAFDTLSALPSKDTLCFIIGIDAFSQFDKWHNWQKILELCHLIVINRPGFNLELSAPLKAYYHQHHTSKLAQLKSAKHGFIYNFEIEPIDISATKIRQMLKEKKDVSKFLPEPVIKYAQKHELYL